MVIFVVEDEHWALKEMVVLLKKYEQQHQIYAFENGIDALSKMEEVIPDLLITDITMPGMTGLELIERSLALDPSLKSIILTVHDEFEYARKGITLGVLDYLLKPIKQASLYEAIDSSIAKIETDKRELQQNTQWSINQLLYSSTHNRSTKNEFEKHSFVVTYIVLENWKASRGWDELNLSNQTIKEYFHDDLKKKVTILTIDSQRKLLLIPYHDSKHSQVQPMMYRFYQFINQYGMVHVSYGLKDTNQALREVFDAVHHQLEDNILFGQSSFVEPNQNNQEKGLTEIWMKIRVLEVSIRNGDVHKVKKQVREMINEIADHKLTLKQLSRLINNMYYAMIYKLTNEIIHVEQSSVNVNLLSEFSSFKQLEEWLVQLLIQLSNQYTSIEQSPKNLIPKVIEWIKYSYQDNITFQQFADNHHVSLSYLSREFKEQIGVTFSEYLMEFRMNKAMKYFEEGMEKASEVGFLVGYQDSKHFRTVFKKMTGMTPREFKTKRSKVK